jgi:hypothetical protein
VASLNVRLERLEKRIVPPPEPKPWMDVVLKTMNHQRAVLDAQEAGREPPGPLVLTLEEQHLELEATE